MLAGHALGQLTAVTAAAHIRAGRLVPLLTQHVVERSSAFIYYGSRAAQPARVRAFIDLAVARFAGNAMLVMTREELSDAQARGLSDLC